MAQKPPKTPLDIVIGIDWADREHAVCVLADGEQTMQTLEQTPAKINEWVAQLHKQFSDAPIGVCLEQKRGPLINALVQHDQLVIFPINPKQLANYRKALYPSGTKNDPNDALLLALFLRDHQDRLRPLQHDATETRQLAQLCELRRKAVDQRKKQVQILTDTLKQYFPLALKLCPSLTHERTLAFLRRWPTHCQLRRAHSDNIKRFLKAEGMRSEAKREEFARLAREIKPLTTDKAITKPYGQWAITLAVQIRSLNKAIREFEEQIAEIFDAQQDAELFKTLPGAGPALAPRIAAIFGTDRDQFANAEEVATVTGVAPVTKTSGNSTVIQKRLFCPKFLRQTWHEFAGLSVQSSRWAAAYYKLQRGRGKKHSATVRALAFKWIRILFQVWKTRTRYDEERYIRQLRKHNSPLVEYLDAAA